MRVEESVGRRVRARRDELGMGQGEFGRKIGPFLGRAWSRSTVSVAEKGDRAWAVADLVAAALVLQTTVGDLIKPPAGVAAVSLGGKDLVPGEILFAVSTAQPREDMNWLLIQTTLQLIADAAARGQGDLARVLELTQDLDAHLTKRVADGGIVSFPAAGAGVDPVPQSGAGASEASEQ